MEVNRRNFIRSIAGGAAALTFGSIPLESIADDLAIEKLTILHTNDWHSRIDPFPKNSGKWAGYGGAAVRSSLIKKIRTEESNVLLLDAGDIWQGTPYFNFFKGLIEYELMNAMGYDCTTLGNHDFDNGLGGLAEMMPKAKFSFLVSNYDTNNTPIHSFIKPYQVFQKGKLKVGVFGIGIELKGLVPDTLCEGVQYLDPIKSANETAAKLKHDEKCNLVICLSHLGYSYKEKKISDATLVGLTRNIDVILGGHTHTFLPEPVVYKNLDDHDVLVNQVGWAGINLGRIDVFFHPKSGKSISNGHTVRIHKKSIT